MCSFTTTWDSAVRRPGICGTAIISLWPPVCTSTIWRRRAVRRRLGGSPSSTSRLEENRHDEVFGLWTGCDRAGDGSGHAGGCTDQYPHRQHRDRKSTRLNSSHLGISYAVFCLKKKKTHTHTTTTT